MVWEVKISRKIIHSGLESMSLQTNLVSLIELFQCIVSINYRSPILLRGHEFSISIIRLGLTPLSALEPTASCHSARPMITGSKVNCP